MGKIKDLTGQRFGKLVVLEATKERRNRQVVWKCQCDCGNITYVVGASLRTNHTKSCGCSNYESKNLNDITGQRFGKLVAIRPVGSTANRVKIWECRCDCGNLVNCNGCDLRQNKIGSCHSCSIKSIGEAQITSILINNKIDFIKEYTFSDLRSPRNYLLRFDFAIFKENQLAYLIEYDGLQHFNASTKFGGEEALKYLQECDKLKDSYCKQHNIKLIRIPYINTHITEKDVILHDLL